MEWEPEDLVNEKKRTAEACLRGIDKDTFLTKVTKAYMAIMGDGRGGVYCANSLAEPSTWPDSLAKDIKLGTFDIVVTNPPFGTKIKINDKNIINQYDLGRKWKLDSKSETFHKTDDLHLKRSPQILFLERCVKLLNDDGRMGVVLPESMVCNPSYRFIMQWLTDNMILQAVVSLPEPLFKTSGKGGTHTKVCVVIAKKQASPPESPNGRLFLSDVRWCGHDSRGKPTERTVDGKQVVLDEVLEVADLYRRHTEREVLSTTRLAHQLEHHNLRSDIYVPKYYDPRIGQQAEKLKTTHDLLRVSKLVEDGCLDIITGVEPGKMSYGMGPIPFIRTSDISNWELKADPKHSVSKDVYSYFKSKCDVRPGDILIVRDGTYLVGTSAMITDADGEMLFQSHILRLRLLKPLPMASPEGTEGAADPQTNGPGVPKDAYLLFAALNSQFVAQQIRAYQFTQDIIDTLGRRINELLLPIPRAPADRMEIADEVKEIVEGRAKLRSRSTVLASSVAAGYKDEPTHASSIR